jgi:hypothetical protein
MSSRKYHRRSIEEASSYGLTPKSLKDLTLHDLESGNFQLLFGSAEDVLYKRNFVLPFTLIEFFTNSNS